MKFLIIIVAMVGAAAGAFHSYNTRNLYIQAALLSEAYTLTANVKLRVADFYLQHGTLPNDNADAGLPPARSLYGTSVKRIAINSGGVLHVDFEAEIGRQSMVFSPEASAVSGHLRWRCSSDNIDPEVLAKLKPGCAYLPLTLESRLMSAIANKDIARVQQLLFDGAKPDAVVNGNTPLMLAAKIGETPIVDALLEAGASVDNSALDTERRTPLMVAIASGQSDVVARLLSVGASVHRKDHKGMTAMDHAIATDQRLGGERYVLLLSAALNPQFAGRSSFAEISLETLSTSERDTRQQALYDELYAAARECHPQRLTTLLLEHKDLSPPVVLAGKPINHHIRQPECSGILLDFLSEKATFRVAANTRFGAVVQACDVRLAESMLRAHPWLEVVERGERQHSPMDRGISSGCADTVALLIREKDLTGRLDGDYLFQAIRHAPQPSLVPLVGSLIAAGADVNGRDNRGQSVLGAAIAFEQPVIAKYLIDAGADVNAITLNGSYPLIEATKKGFDHLVEQLVSHGARLDQRDALGRTALLSAVARERDRLVDKLLRAGANPRVKDSNGIDALVLAESRNLSQIHHLIASVADR